MKNVLFTLLLLIPFYSISQTKWEYVEFTLSTNIKTYYVEVSKSDTGIYKQVFWDADKEKPKRFHRPVDIFNALGELGFELVVIADRQALLGKEAVYTFKRPKPNL